MAAVIESMTRVERGPYIVRIWRQEEVIVDKDTLKDGYDNDDVRLVILRIPWTSLNPKRIVEEVVKLPRINAVEVINRQGDGIVYYPDWP